MLAVPPTARSGAQPGKCQIAYADIEEHTAGWGRRGNAKRNRARGPDFANM
jgi:hypothetical protein